MKKLALALILFALFCVVARGGPIKAPAGSGLPDVPEVAAVLAKAEPAKADQPAAEPAKPGQAIQVTVPPQAAPVVVTTPEAPTLADQVTKLIGMLSGLVALAWTIYQEARHKFQQFRDTQSPSPRPWTDEEYFAESRRRFPQNPQKG